MPESGASFTMSQDYLISKSLSEITTGLKLSLGCVKTASLCEGQNRNPLTSFNWFNAEMV